VAYPTQNIGLRVRSVNGRGSVIANAMFTGYAPKASTTSKVQLADVFDPQGRTHDIVAVILEDAWDPYSRSLVESLMAASPARVALFQVLGQGSTPNVAATQSDLSTWHTRYPVSAAWTVLDPLFTRFPAPLYDNSAVPAIIILDARTMEIVSSEVGKPSNPTVTLEGFRDAVKARLPAY
jgi:hypothetical protein